MFQKLMRNFNEILQNIWKTIEEQIFKKFIKLGRTLAKNRDKLCKFLKIGDLLIIRLEMFLKVEKIYNF